jgi:hypothetical protein
MCCRDLTTANSPTLSRAPSSVTDPPPLPGLPRELCRSARIGRRVSATPGTRAGSLTRSRNEAAASDRQVCLCKQTRLRVRPCPSGRRELIMREPDVAMRSTRHRQYRSEPHFNIEPAAEEDLVVVAENQERRSARQGVLGCCQRTIWLAPPLQFLRRFPSTLLLLTLSITSASWLDKEAE